MVRSILGPYRLSVLSWSDISGLTREANGLYREEWSLLDWLSENLSSASDEDVGAVVDMLIRNGQRIDALGDSAFRRGW